MMNMELCYAKKIQPKIDVTMALVTKYLLFRMFKYSEKKKF